MAKKPDVTKKFGEKRSAIVHAASVLINETGVQATTLTKVARATRPALPIIFRARTS